MQVLTSDGAVRDGRREHAFPFSGTVSSSWSDSSIPLLGLDAQASYNALYKSNPWVFAGVRAIAIGMSRNKLGVYRREANGDRLRIRYDGPGNDIGGKDLDRLLNGPVRRQGSAKRMRRTVVDYLVRGNALWEETSDGLVLIPWRRVSPILSADNEILGWDITSSKPGGHRQLPPENVVHFSGGDDPDSELGVSVLASLRYTLQLFEALQRHMVKFFENSARPSGNLKVDKLQDQEKLAWMQEQFRQLYTSPENAGKVIITTGDFQPITAGADQSQLIELVKLSREEIASVLRIPMPVLGVLDNAIKSNVRELRVQMTRDTLGGYSSSFEDEIMAQVVDPSVAYEGLFTEWDFDDQLRPDFEALATAFVQMEKTMTTNERRAMLNKPALDFPEADTVATTPGSAYMGIAAPEPPAAATPPEDQATGGGDENEDADENESADAVQ